MRRIPLPLFQSRCDSFAGFAVAGNAVAILGELSCLGNEIPSAKLAGYQIGCRQNVLLEQEDVILFFVPELIFLLIECITRGIYEIVENCRDISGKEGDC